LFVFYVKLLLTFCQLKATEKKTEKHQKRPKNSTFKTLSAIFVPCMKIQGGHGPSADAHASEYA